MRKKKITMRKMEEEEEEEDDKKKKQMKKKALKFLLFTIFRDVHRLISTWTEHVSLPAASCDIQR